MEKIEETVIEMARSRNIKPGFFLNDILAEIDPLGRLLFIGLWTIADRAGRLDDRPKKIKAAVLPYDNCDIEQLLHELHQRNFIIRYEKDSEKYIQIANWDKHQNPHVKEPASNIPAPYEYSASTVQVPDDNSERTITSVLIPDSLNLIPDSGFLIPDSVDITQIEREILHIFSIIENYKFDYKKDLELIRSLAIDFPKIDLLEQAKSWKVYKIDNPLEPKSNARSQFRTWCKKAVEYQQKYPTYQQYAPQVNVQQKPSVATEVPASVARLQQRFRGGLNG